MLDINFYIQHPLILNTAHITSYAACRSSVSLASPHFPAFWCVIHLIAFFSLSFSMQASFSWLFFCGAVLIVMAFIGVTVLDHFGAWDPLWVGIKKLFLMAKDVR